MSNLAYQTMGRAEPEPTRVSLMEIHKNTSQTNERLRATIEHLGGLLTTTRSLMNGPTPTISENKGERCVPSSLGDMSREQHSLLDEIGAQLDALNSLISGANR